MVDSGISERRNRTESENGMFRRPMALAHGFNHGIMMRAQIPDIY